MRYYETVVIIHPALEGGMLKDNIIEVQKLVEQKGGELKNTEVWGRKKLAYLIDKQKYGTYTMLQYTGEIIKINEMNVEMEHNPNILAYMTIKIDESELKEQTKDLDAQIDGQASQNDEEETKPAAQ
ncbi:MAG: 30S ribosomal protein S6, partial [Fidelibacterota bacterium]